MNSSMSACSVAFRVHLHIIQALLKFLLSPIIDEDVEEVNNMQKYWLGSYRQAICRRDTPKTILWSNF